MKLSELIRDLQTILTLAPHDPPVVVSVRSKEEMSIQPTHTPTHIEGLSSLLNTGKIEVVSLVCIEGGVPPPKQPTMQEFLDFVMFGGSKVKPPKPNGQ